MSIPRSFLTFVLVFAGVLGSCASVDHQHSTDATPPDDAAEAGATDAAGAADEDAADDEGTDSSGDDDAGETSTAGEDDESEKERKEKEEKEKKEREAAAKKWKEAVEDLEETTGFFKIHHGEFKVLLELDEDALGREFLYFGGLGSGAGNGSVYRGAMLEDSSQVLRFERRGEDKIALVAENTRYLEGEDPIESRMLEDVTSESVLEVFPFAAENKDEKRWLIDLGGFLLQDNFQLSRGLGKMKPNKDLSEFTKVGNFPRNVEIDVQMAFSGDKSGGNLTLADGRGATLHVHHSFCALPKDGYRKRMSDQRVGYFTTERKDLFDLQSDDPVERYVNRWRLQKKDPTAEVSDPVQPIVYWIENSTPKKWRDAVREGIEMWEPAFRKAGFSNAIVAKQMPDDAAWDPADVRYSVVRWSNDENVGFAIGPSRVDPRTGEIFDADITMQASFVSIYQQRFQTYVDDLAHRPKAEVLAEVRERMTPRREVPVDADALRRCTFAGRELTERAAVANAIASLQVDDYDADAFLHAMLREVVAHEVGHTLGLRHNFKASTMLGLDGLSDVERTARTGVVGSVMEYGAINLSSPGQPQGEFFSSAVGPYDVWAIEFGYSEFGSNEAAALREIANRSPEPELVYGTDEDMYFGDAYATVWDLGADPVAFARSQVALAEEGFRVLADKGAERGEPFHKYSDFYGMHASHYLRNVYGLDRYIGGYTLHRDLVGQPNVRPPIVPVDVATQRAALDHMIDKGLRWTGGVPDEQRLLLANQKYGSWGSWFDPWTLDPLPRVVNMTRYSVLAALTNPALYERLGSQARYVAQGGLATTEVAERVFNALWESDAPDEHDRWTQTDYVGLLVVALQFDVSPDVTALFDSMLTRAEGRLAAYANSGDPLVAAHGSSLGDRIKRWRERDTVDFGF